VSQTLPDDSRCNRRMPNSGMKAAVHQRWSLRARTPVGPGLAVAAALVGCALVAVEAISRVEPDAPALFLLPAAIAVITRLSGRHVGSIAALIGIIAFEYLYIPPRYDLLPSDQSWPRLVAFSICAAAAVALTQLRPLRLRVAGESASNIVGVAHAVDRSAR